MVVRILAHILLVGLLAITLTNGRATAATGDGLSPPANTPESDDVEQLLNEARELFLINHPIDARSRLLRALQVAPRDYRPHMWLGRYYLSDVGHFQLAYRYLREAERLFEERFGSDRNNSLDPSAWREHATLLYLRSEAELNLDLYSQALDTLDRFANRYWDQWYPGTRAWVLMKLKRVDEAITVAQAGLLRGAEPGRTYNILGILFSLKGNRELALNAFELAIRSESLLANNSQIATPLNNAGEVYRELFQDEMAEAAWVQALQLPDGCDHILPSLNLAVLYIDQLRLFQAERVLSDFEACFASRSTREDTEHRVLLALVRGRIALLKGDVEKAVANLTQAMERRQWFGKIGTNENDVRFAAHGALALALEAQAALLEERGDFGFLKWLQSAVEAPWLRVRAWWLKRRAREIALEELEDFEDLFIRHTDTMLEYPTLGRVLAGFPARAFRARTERMLAEDQREPAHAYYRLYLAKNLLGNGREREALANLRDLQTAFRPIDRLARAELLALTMLAENENRGFFTRVSVEDERRILGLKEELFGLLPSHLRYFGIALPVTFRVSPDGKQSDVEREIIALLTKRRFEKASEALARTVRHTVAIELSPLDGGRYEAIIALQEQRSGRTLAWTRGNISASNRDDLVELVEQFFGKAFAPVTDPPGQPLPKLKILEGVL